MTDRLMLLDTASMYFRAFFGVPEIKAPNGTPVNAVRGLLDFISRLVGEYQPDHLVCCWDNDWRPQWRVDLLPSYKSHRVVVARPGADPGRRGGPRPARGPGPGHRGRAEGVRHRHGRRRRLRGRRRDRHPRHRRRSSPVDVVTGDRDLFQLVDDDADVRVLYIARGVGKHERVTNDWVRDKYGIDARQYADFATLRGDASDGLPGVAGVGEKTAATLLQRFGDMPGIVAAADDPDADMGPGPRGKIKAAPTTSRSRPPWSPSPATSTSAPPTPRCPAPPRTPTCSPPSRRSSG